MKLGQFVWFLLGLGGGYLLWDITHDDVVQEALQADITAAGQVRGCTSESIFEYVDGLRPAFDSSHSYSIPAAWRAKLEETPAVEFLQGEAPDEQGRADTAGISPQVISNKLVELGVQPEVAESLKLLIGEDRMAVLQMRNRAIREGWLNTSEYQVKLQSLSATSNKIRAEFGDAVYDRYLYASKRTNRVDVVDIYPGSAAEAIGLQSGDRILRYGSKPVYSIDELVDLTASANDGESTLVEFLRGNQSMFATVPRGPLGVLLSAQHVRPEAIEE